MHLNTLGFIVTQKKSTLSPTQSMLFLGLDLDSGTYSGFRL